MNRLVDRGRLERFASFGAIGATGVVLDVAVVALVLEAGASVLGANFFAWILAASWNFAGNWRFTYDRPDEHVLLLYWEYLGTRLASFAARGLLVVALVELLAVGELAASIAGIAAAALVGFALCETVVFGGDDE